MVLAELESTKNTWYVCPHVGIFGTIDENSLIEGLPLKLKTDLLIDVHYTTLSKVALFRDCERTMIFDLICKLKPILFLPGALVCQKVANAPIAVI